MAAVISRWGGLPIDLPRCLGGPAGDPPDWGRAARPTRFFRFPGGDALFQRNLGNEMGPEGVKGGDCNSRKTFRPVYLRNKDPNPSFRIKSRAKPRAAGSLRFAVPSLQESHTVPRGSSSKCAKYDFWLWKLNLSVLPQAPNPP